MVAEIRCVSTIGRTEEAEAGGAASNNLISEKQFEVRIEVGQRSLDVFWRRGRFLRRRIERV